MSDRAFLWTESLSKLDSMDKVIYLFKLLRLRVSKVHLEVELMIGAPPGFVTVFEDGEYPIQRLSLSWLVAAFQKMGANNQQILLLIRLYERIEHFSNPGSRKGPPDMTRVQKWTM